MKRSDFELARKKAVEEEAATRMAMRRQWQIGDMLAVEYQAPDVNSGAKNLGSFGVVSYCGTRVGAMPSTVHNLSIWKMKAWQVRAVLWLRWQCFLWASGLIDELPPSHIDLGSDARLDEFDPCAAMEAAVELERLVEQLAQDEFARDVELYRQKLIDRVNTWMPETAENR